MSKFFTKKDLDCQVTALLAMTWLFRMNATLSFWWL